MMPIAPATLSSAFAHDGKAFRRLVRLAAALAVIVLAGGSGIARSQENNKAGAAAVQPKAELFVRAIRDYQESGAMKPLVMQFQVRYRNPYAAEVTLVWGLNKFALAPANMPPGTTLTYNRSHMNTPMKREGDLFTVDYEVAENTRLDYAFIITKTAKGETVEHWRAPARVSRITQQRSRSTAPMRSSTSRRTRFTT